MGQQHGVFVIRHKKKLKYNTIKELDLPDDRLQHIMKDEIMELAHEDSKKKYNDKLRHVIVWNEENQQVIELIINQLSWSPNTISELYKAR